ncbi:DUF2971 domain-containing protein [Liquorilactobacillus uvarum]|uniref:DUF2971 domain-containing protein n=1 Tax=Liquorilactobacillus uvarum DSM 19971 TaxID=1423812 RepID=A0A0R1PL33_9LACO|nr:DUF2971 domain-containing protein [Liquorilactobacillus uvarum]KRL32812.1 hypothetical protein FD20_GL002219 [Liquorilactobacillus uvarum DSM 19971]
MRLIDVLEDTSIPEETLEMIRSLPPTGKEALDNYFNEDSNFFKHSRPKLIIPKLSCDTSLNENLYHYTTVGSLTKIVHSKEWMIKQKDFMNDPKEFQYTVDLSVAILDTLDATSDEKKLFIETFENGPFGDTYIWSFTKNKNSQTLFGNYSGNKDGVALGFKLSDVQVALATHFSHGKTDPNKLTKGDAFVFPLKVIYDKTIQLEYLKPVVKEWLFAQRNLARDQYDMSEIILACLPAITLFALTFKNPLLRQEEEVRFIITNIREDTKLHPEAYIGKIPYVKCEVSDFLIKEAIIQTGNVISNEQLLSLFNDNGFTDIIVKKSDLPY